MHVLRRLYLGASRRQKKGFGLYGHAGGIKRRGRGPSWVEALKQTDELASTDIPNYLYGAANIYAAFSDYTFYSVNYGLGGFMEANGDKRNDEPYRNPYNSMYLRSKSREYFYRVLGVLGYNQTTNEEQKYLEFMSNMRLGRHAQAEEVLDRISIARSGGLITEYANMVWSVEARTNSAEERLEKLLGKRETNSFYYLAKHLALNKNFKDAKMVLSALIKKADVPMCTSLMRRINEVEAAAGCY